MLHLRPRALVSAARTQDTIICGGETLTLTVTSTSNDNGIAWGVGTLSGGTHLIPLSFSFTATDLTTDTVIFADTQSKGHGNGMHNQTMITSPESGQATAGEIGIPGRRPERHHRVHIHGDSSTQAVTARRTGGGRGRRSFTTFSPPGGTSKNPRTVGTGEARRAAAEPLDTRDQGSWAQPKTDAVLDAPLLHLRGDQEPSPVDVRVTQVAGTSAAMIEATYGHKMGDLGNRWRAALDASDQTFGHLSDTGR